jgi:hypothetical protein
LKPDPIDQLAARLFESARREVIPHAAEQRALQAARLAVSENTRANRAFSARRGWLAAAACVAIAASTILLLRTQEASLGIRAEPSTLARAQPERRAVPQPAPSEAVPAVPSLALTAKPAASAAPMPVHSAPASLSDELGALKLASNALSAGDPKAALAALDHYDRVLKGRKLRAEATLLRVEALSRAGQVQSASALAQSFVDQNPGSPLVDRARSFVVQ